MPDTFNHSSTPAAISGAAANSCTLLTLSAVEVLDVFAHLDS